MAEHSPAPRAPVGGGVNGVSGVIHDLGYRPYDGPRATEGVIAVALFVSGLRNAFGLGRSGKSKVLPFLLLGLNLLPAVIVVGVMVLVGLDRLPIDYARYASSTQILLSIFVAAQAPVLFSRDLRHGTIALYLARPLSSAAYAVSRWASLLAATLVFLLVPVLALYAGAVLGELDFWEQTRGAVKAVLLAVLLALMLTGVGGLIASVSVRRGFAVVATIAVLLLGNGVVTAVQGISESQGEPRVGEVAGLFSPYSLYRGSMAAITDNFALTPPTGSSMTAAYFAVTVLIGAAGVGGLVVRYRRIAGR
jgi:ABC-2 type transport system permease protein